MSTYCGEIFIHPPLSSHLSPAVLHATNAGDKKGKIGDGPERRETGAPNKRDALLYRVLSLFLCVCVCVMMYVGRTCQWQMRRGGAAVWPKAIERNGTFFSLFFWTQFVWDIFFFCWTFIYVRQTLETAVCSHIPWKRIVWNASKKIESQLAK
jgi:hypothetical protein